MTMQLQNEGPALWKVEELEDFGIGYVVFHFNIESRTRKDFIKEMLNNDLPEVVFGSS